MSTTLQRIGGPLAALPLALTLLSGSALASSHREAPFITTAPKVDASDFYMFRSYEPARFAMLVEAAFVHKLSYKYDPADAVAGTIVDHLVSGRYPGAPESL